MFGLLAAAPASSEEFALSASPPAAGFVRVDEGRLEMRGGTLQRREDFEVWRGPSGERWLRSVVTAADGSYRVEGEWRSDAAGQRHAVRGRGAIGGEPLAVQVDAEPGRASMKVVRGAREPEILQAKCTPACLVDLAPSAVAMFAMTLDERVRRGEPREFRWVGHSLNADSVLVDGVARFLRIGEQDVRRPDGSTLTVRHDVFQETVTDLRTGVTVKVFFNLWSDVQGRPLKFASSRVTGLRAGYEDLGQLAPATLEAAFPTATAP